MQIILFPSLLPSFPSDPAFLSFAVSPPPFHPVFFFFLLKYGPHGEVLKTLCSAGPSVPFLFPRKALS